MAQPSMREGARAASDALRLVAIASAAQVVSLGLNILLRGALGPAGMGYVAIMLLALSCAAFGGFGALQAVERDIPIELGRGRTREAQALEVAALTISIVGGSAAALILVAVSLVDVISTDSTLRLILRISAAAIVIHQLTLVGIVHVRTRLQFRMLAWFNGIMSVSTVGVLWVGAIIGGVTGAALALLLLTGLSAGSIMWAGGMDVHGLNLVSIRRVLGLAPSFLVANLAVYGLLTIDQLAVGFLLGGPALGTYSAALLGRGFVLGLPSMATSVIYPRLQLELGATAEGAAVAGLAARATALMAVLMPLVVALFYVLLPPVVEVLLPAFSDALEPLRLLLIATGALAFGFPATQLLLTLDRQWLEARITLSVLALVGVAYLALALAGPLTLSAIASVIAVASIAHALSVHWAAARTMGGWHGVTLRYAVAHMLPLITLVAVDAAIATWTTSAGQQGFSDLVVAILQVAAFSAAWLLAYHLVLRRDAQLREDAAMLIAAARARLGVA